MIFRKNKIKITDTPKRKGRKQKTVKIFLSKRKIPTKKQSQEMFKEAHKKAMKKCKPFTKKFGECFALELEKIREKKGFGFK